ncbi:MAG: TlpA family protein disulfide reductase [Balneolaceae bacterium]|nr:MAG: TlpA family protein disulfide reductase [Balneolaceae bacterium]
MKCIRIALLLSSLFLLLLLSSCMRTGNHQLSEDQVRLVEEARFFDWEGNTVSVSDFAGKIVVIDFWESWCGPCRSAFPGFQRALNEFPDDIVIIAATVGWNEGRDEALRFIEENRYDFVFVNGRNISSALDITGIPYKVILDREGRLIGAQAGSAGAEREYEKLRNLIAAHS